MAVLYASISACNREPVQGDKERCDMVNFMLVDV